jgi:hypothetical protein
VYTPSLNTQQSLDGATYSKEDLGSWHNLKTNECAHVKVLMKLHVFLLGMQQMVTGFQDLKMSTTALEARKRSVHAFEYLSRNKRRTHSGVVLPLLYLLGHAT